jgi:hypothetical protein
MSDELKMDAALNLARLLARYEAALDAAVAAGADLAGAIPRARVAARQPAMIGQSALDRVGDSLQATITARRHAVDGHRLLDATRGKLGLPVIAFGEEDDKIWPEGALADDAAVETVRITV